MAVFKCKMCGGNLNVSDNSGVVVCEYCGTNQTISKFRDDVVTNLYNRANDLRLNSEFDRAEQTYEKILEYSNAEAEAHWCIVLCRYGIEYVEDPKTGKRIPTCHRTSYESIISDSDYIAAINSADSEQKVLYEQEAKSIDEIQKNILNIVKNESPFDIFICYKETDENGKRTIDSSLSNDIYYQLTQEGFKVFYAPITLEDKLGEEYEPYIFAALSSAKVMLVVGTKPEYFNAVWVKNEWSRYLKLLKSDRSKLLIPCYRDMDAYNLPDEFAHLQSQDMSKIGFINDLVRGIKKIITVDNKNTENRIQNEQKTIVETPIVKTQIAENIVPPKEEPKVLNSQPQQEKIKQTNKKKKLPIIIIAAILVITIIASLFFVVPIISKNIKYALTEENIEYIKNIDADVSITIIGAEKDFIETSIYYAQNYYGVTISNESDYEYFNFTGFALDKYNHYNSKISVDYVDPQSTEFTAISTNYSSYNLNYGDIIVTSNVSGKKRVKVLKFENIYVSTNSDSSNAQSYTITGNKIETALTSAIAYVTSADTKKVAVITGHSNNNYTDAYAELLTTNNYDITNISDKLITNISSEYDAIVVSAPTIDFIDSEIDVISSFLENDGKMGKGLIFFADATCPALPNFYSFLKQWGIEVGKGILYETDANMHIGDHSTMMMFPVQFSKDDITDNLNGTIANYIVPMKTCDTLNAQRSSKALMQTSTTVVVAPTGFKSDWADYKDEDKTQFDCVIQAVENSYDKDNNEIASYVMAFASVEFVQSEWASSAALSNQDIVMACTDRASGVENNMVSFTTKVFE